MPPPDRPAAFAVIEREGLLALVQVERGRRGLVLDLPAFGLGGRSERYSMVVEDGEDAREALQLLLGLSSTIYGLTVIGTLRHAPFDDGAPLYSGRFDDLIRDYVHFVGRGLLGA